MTESGRAPADAISPSESTVANEVSAAAAAPGTKPSAGSGWWSPLLKYGVTIGLLVWIFWNPANREPFLKIWDQPKDWPLLAAALGVTLLTVTITIVRWWFLVRALEVPCSLAEAMRLGFVGYLLNFVSVGSVGGDLFKVYFLARDRVGLRAECVASGVVDRLLGLYALFLLVTTVTLVTGLAGQAPPGVRYTIFFAWALTGVLTCGFAFLMSPYLLNTVSDARLAKFPRVLQMVIHLIRAVRLYRQRPGLMLVAIAVSVATHAMFAVAFWLIGQGLLVTTPGLATQLVVIPLATLAGSVPLPGGGLGAFEAVTALLYSTVPSDPQTSYAEGLLKAFSFRAITILVALIGLAYYLVSRREVNRALAAAAAAEQK